MKAYQLYMPPCGELAKMDQKPAGAFVCDKCKRIWNSEHDANRCCICSYCGEELERGEVCSHWKCMQKARLKSYDETLAKAEAVDHDKHNGFVYCDHGGPNDGYAENLEVMAEWWHEAIANGEYAREDYPEFVQVCNPSPPPVITVHDLIERICDDGFEDMNEQVTIPPGLEKALQEFNEANKGLVSWCPDSKRKIKMPPLELEPEEEDADENTDGAAEKPADRIMKVLAFDGPESIDGVETIVSWAKKRGCPEVDTQLILEWAAKQHCSARTEECGWCSHKMMVLCSPCSARHLLGGSAI